MRVFSILIVSFILSFGNLFAQHQSQTFVPSESLKKAIYLLKTKYLFWPQENLTDSQLSNYMILGAFRNVIDVYTVAVPEDKIRPEKEYENECSLGVEIVAKGDEIQIVKILFESPADSAGLKVGDILVGINNLTVTTNTSPFDFAEATKEDNNNIKINRNGKILSFCISKEKIPSNGDYQIFSGNLSPDIGYVRISSFHDDMSNSLERAINALVKNKTKSIIIDLRGNGGGHISQCKKALNLFIEQGKLLYICQSRGKDPGSFVLEKEFAPNKAICSLPVVLLVDEYTASASEAFATSLKKNRTATIVGNKTFGKGVFQQSYRLPNGMALVITAGRILGPNQETWHEIGIQPDISVSLIDMNKQYNIIELKQITNKIFGLWPFYNSNDRMFLMFPSEDIQLKAAIKAASEKIK